MGLFNDRRKSPHLCFKCGKEEVRVEHFGDVLEFKGLTLEVHGLARSHCKACGYVWTTDGQEHDNLALIRQAFAARRDEIRTSEGLLTGEQIEDVLELLSLTKADAARLFGGGPNAFSKYISGDVLQSFAMDRLVRLTLLFGDAAIQLLSLGKHAPLSLNAGHRSLVSTVTTSTPVQMQTANVKPPAIQIARALSTSSPAAQH